MMKPKKAAILIIVSLLLISLCFSGEHKKINSNQPQKVETGKMTKKNSYVVENLPQKAEKLKLKEKDYYFNNGIFYKRVQNGYQIVKPPYGTKIKHLPDGVRFFRRHNIDYYYYYYTYYRYDPQLEVYIVINEPEWADKRYYDDRLNLVNGSVLVGQYLGGDREAVDFLFDRELKRIRREEIISLEFAPALLEQDF